jgi:hypothetical protein
MVFNTSPSGTRSVSFLAGVAASFFEGEASEDAFDEFEPFDLLVVAFSFLGSAF